MYYKLASNQANFIAKFLSEEGNNRHILIAPHGFGKSTIIMIIIEELLKRKNVGPIMLFGTDKISTTLFFERIRNFTKNVLLIEKKTFLELDDASDNKDTLWKNGWIYISTAFLLNDERFTQRIKNTKWELIVLDNATERAIDEVENIKFESKHLLLAARAYDIGSLENISNYSITRWNSQDIIFRIIPPERVNNFIIKFSRTKKEKEHLQEILMFLHEIFSLEPNEETPWIESFSSLYSTEQFLLKVRNAMVHGNENIFRLGENEWILKSDPGNIQRIENYLNLIDSIEKDAKIDVLNKLLNSFQPDLKRSILIFANSTASIDYINSTLNKKGYNSINLHQSLNRAKFVEEVDHFQSSGGILIANDYILKGIELSANILIHFDLPKDENLLFYRISRIPSKENILISNYFLVEDENMDELNKLKSLGITGKNNSL